jgi:quinolinate synthase
VNQLIEKINKLKIERNAVILAHNYQVPEVQDIADITGDSLELSRKAANTTADVIVFCGVRFMGETAHILSPQKTVLLPEPNAGCPLADMITVEQLREMKAKNPGAVTVCYVNSSAEVKAESDICCTSANAVKVVASIDPDKPVIFVPCKHLGGYVERVTGRKLILANGFCPTHHRIIKEHILDLKLKYPDAEVMAHPECSREVLEVTDHICSTGQMFTAVEKSSATRFIVGTENGMTHPLKKRFPDREFIIIGDHTICPNMKKINLEKVLWSLENLQHRVELDADIRARALNSIQRMLEFA